MDLFLKEALKLRFFVRILVAEVFFLLFFVDFIFRLLKPKPFFFIQLVLFNVPPFHSSNEEVAHYISFFILLLF